jgi:hypothetical protein
VEVYAFSFDRSRNNDYEIKRFEMLGIDINSWHDGSASRYYSWNPTYSRAKTSWLEKLVSILTSPVVEDSPLPDSSYLLLCSSWPCQRTNKTQSRPSSTYGTFSSVPIPILVLYWSRVLAYNAWQCLFDKEAFLNTKALVLPSVLFHLKFLSKSYARGPLCH